MKQQEGVRERLDGSRQCAQEDKLHTFWLQVVKASFLRLNLKCLPCLAYVMPEQSYSANTELFFADVCSLDCLLESSLLWRSL